MTMNKMNTGLEINTATDYRDGWRRLRLREFVPPEAITEDSMRQALGFIEEVKARFQDTPENYRIFCHVLKTLARSRIEPDDVGRGGLQLKYLLWTLRKILDGQQDLIDKFKFYLPENLRATMEEDDDAEAFEEAMSFLIKMWKRNGDDLFKVMSSWESREAEGEGGDLIGSFLPIARVEAEAVEEAMSFLIKMWKRNGDDFFKVMSSCKSREAEDKGGDLIGSFLPIAGVEADGEEEETSGIREEETGGSREEEAQVVEGGEEEEDERFQGLIEKLPFKLKYMKILPILYLHSSGKEINHTEFVNLPNIIEETRTLLQNRMPQDRQIPDEGELGLSKCTRISPSYQLLPETFRTTLVDANKQQRPLKTSCISVPDDDNTNCYMKIRKHVPHTDEMLFRMDEDLYEESMLKERQRHNEGELARISPSYRLLPDKSKTTLADANERQQLPNTSCAPVTNDDNTNYYRMKRKHSPHTEMLFKVGEDGFTNSMMTEFLNLGIKYTEKKMEGTDGGMETLERIQFVRCVKSMFGAQGPQVVEMFDALPLPTARKRLLDKLGELERVTGV